ncbi:MAG: HD domain-containing protein, partial [Actinobacteria bacterium]
IHGFEIQRAEVMLLLSLLTQADSRERAGIPGMPADRVDVILPGALVMAEVMKLTGAGSVVINARGIREGIVIDSVDRSPAAADEGIDRIAGVRAFGDRCAYDESHATHVAGLATSLFDQLATALSIDVGTRPLLEAAALLHDVGYCIAYDRHHRHTYHLVVHASLPGFTNREVRRIASIARYHTKALPKSGHEAWASLDEADRRVVEPLAAILRLADGLDRGRAGHVWRVEASPGAGELRLVVVGEGELHPELYGVEKKKDLFERVFGLCVAVEVRPSSE